MFILSPIVTVRNGILRANHIWPNFDVQITMYASVLFAINLVIYILLTVYNEYMTKKT